MHYKLVFFLAGNLNAFAVLGGIIIASVGIIIGITIVFYMRRKLSNRQIDDSGKAGISNDESYHLAEIKIGKFHDHHKICKND